MAKKSFYDWEQKFKPKHKKEKKQKNLKNRLGIPEDQYEKLMRNFRKDLPNDI